MNIKFLFLLLFSIPSVSIAQPFVSDTDETGFIAFGDLRGYLEPCGCDPENDLGGVKRLAAQIKRERLQFPSLKLFSLGNVLSPFEEEWIKDGFLLEAIKDLNVDAYLFNRTEQLKYIRNDAIAADKFLLSNSTKKVTGVARKIKTGSYEVFGYVSPQDNILTLDPAIKWLNGVEPDSKLTSVLLFSGTDADLALLTKSGKFKIVLSSNVRPFEWSPGLDEKNNEQLLLRAGVWMVPLGGQGFLRGGALQRQKALSLSELSTNKVCKESVVPDRHCDNVTDLQVSLNFVTWLIRSVGGDEFYVDLFKRYNSAVTASFTAASKERLSFLKDSKYIGAESCESCHKTAYDAWKKSDHAHAYATLEKKEKDKDAECVSCHVLGAKEKGGFVDIKNSPQFANVQCEVCHGPRKEHAANPKIKVEHRADKVCESCHHPPHSSNFNYNEYWKQIFHGK